MRVARCALLLVIALPVRPAGAKPKTPPADPPIDMAAHTIKAGDTLWKIAKQHATTVASIRTANGLKGSLIRVGTVLRVPKGPFRVLVTKGKHTLQLLQGNKTIKTYRVGLGRDKTTPSGTFTVVAKLLIPTWHDDQGRIPPDDPRNILGSRWIAFKGRIGIHGSRKVDEKNIGKNTTLGCVLMRDADVIELYDFLVVGKSTIKLAD